MEEIIKVIIDADHEARDKVERIENEGNQLHVMLQEQRANIMQEQEAAADVKRAKYKQELEKELAQNQKQNDQEYEETSKTLRQLFEKEKDSWIHEIYEHCLGKS